MLVVFNLVLVHYVAHQGKMQWPAHAKKELLWLDFHT
jgi:hypothetical protein